MTARMQSQALWDHPTREDRIHPMECPELKDAHKLTGFVVRLSQKLVERKAGRSLGS